MYWRRTLYVLSIAASHLPKIPTVRDTFHASGNTILSPSYEFNNNESWNNPICQNDALRTCAYVPTLCHQLWSLNLLICSQAVHSIFKRCFKLTSITSPLTRERAEQLDINTMEVSRKMSRYADIYTTTINDARGIKVVLYQQLRASWFGSLVLTRLRFIPNQIPLLVDGFFASEAFTYLLYKAFAEVNFEECNKIGDAAEQLGQVSLATLGMDPETLDPIWEASVRDEGFLLHTCICSSTKAVLVNLMLRSVSWVICIKCGISFMSLIILT